MDDRGNLLTRKQVRERYGFSLTFIDKHLPRTKVGGKVLFNAEALQGLLTGPGRPRTVPDHRGLAWEAMRLWDVNERRLLCDVKPNDEENC